MANQITTYLKYANLQMAAESLFGILPTDLAGKTSTSMTEQSLIEGNTRSSKFTVEQAKQFLDADKWTVVEHKSNTGTGFSGTLFKNTETGELVMSFRTTEFADNAVRDNQATNNLEIKWFTAIAWMTAPFNTGTVAVPKQAWRQCMLRIKGLASIGVMLLLACSTTIACKPREVPVACTPLPMVNGHVTAMSEGNKMRLRVPANVELTHDCKQIKSVELRYYWYKGELVWALGAEPVRDIPQEVLGSPIKIFVTRFTTLSDIAPITPKPWRFEGAVKYEKYPLVYYPKYYWTAPDQPPAHAALGVKCGIVGTHSPISGSPFTVPCDVLRSFNETQTDVIKGEFPKGEFRGGITVVKGDKVVFAMIDVFTSNAHDIDKIYNAAIAKIQTYIQE